LLKSLRILWQSGLLDVYSLAVMVGSLIILLWLYFEMIHTLRLNDEAYIVKSELINIRIYKKISILLFYILATFVSYIWAVEFISNPYAFYMIFFASIGLFFFGLLSVKSFLKQTFVIAPLIRIWLDLENAFLFFILVNAVFAWTQSVNFMVIFILAMIVSLLTLLSLSFTDQKFNRKLVLWVVFVALESIMLITIFFDMASALYVLNFTYWALLLLLHMKMNGVRNWIEFLLPLILFLSLLFGF
jgi:hypothetical protein